MAGAAAARSTTAGSMLGETCSASFDSAAPGRPEMCPMERPTCVGYDSSKMQMGYCQAEFRSDGKKWAFVMMSWDRDGEPHGERLWGCIALAQALQRLSSIKVLLLTNTTHFADGTEVASSFRRLNVEVLPVHPVRPLNGERWGREDWDIAFWKLQAWKLTDYDKLLWIDSDSIVYRSLDWIFGQEGMVAARDDRSCSTLHPSPHTGLLLLEPSVADFEGMLELTRGALPETYHEVISVYFKEVKQRTFTLLTDIDSAFGHCLGKAPSVYLNSDGTSVRGTWDIPAFVHKSGGWRAEDHMYDNVCFSHNLTRQTYFVGDSEMNVCQYHPLGAYWRSRFCEGASILGLDLREIQEFCNDECYYRGKGGGACGNVTGTTRHDVTAKAKGIPKPEFFRLNVYRVDNSRLKALTQGLGYRMSMSIHDKDGDSLVRWGKEVTGHDEGNGWLRVGDRYLPFELQGVPVLTLQ